MKKELRRQIRSTLDAVDARERQRRSAAACAQLFGSLEYLEARTIMLFLSLPTEIDTTEIALRAWSDGRRVLAPKVSWEQKRMQAVEITSLTGGIAPDAMGIREPIEGPPTPVDEIDLVIVPGLAFDSDGNRLGRGRGFYDRFLANPDFRGVACGFAYEFQVIDAVPHDENDRRVDLLITDAQVRYFRRRNP